MAKPSPILTVPPSRQKEGSSNLDNGHFPLEIVFEHLECAIHLLSPVEEKANDRTCESIDGTIDDEKHAGLRKIIDHMFNNAILYGLCSC